jgi:hypothetical protein
MMGDRIPAESREPGVIEPEETTPAGEVDTEDLPESGTSVSVMHMGPANAGFSGTIVPPGVRTLINMQQQERRIT